LLAEVARALHATGAHIYIAVRDTNKGRKVADDIQSADKTGAQISVLKLDLDSLKSVRECAYAFLKDSKQLNLLINNAGITLLLFLSFCEINLDPGEVG
jgi:NAD(P)-dependent dehydrogenase (short-subunit alcohol dehydrogenase family)